MFLRASTQDNKGEKGMHILRSHKTDKHTFIFRSNASLSCFIHCYFTDAETSLDNYKKHT